MGFFTFIVVGLVVMLIVYYTFMTSTSTESERINLKMKYFENEIETPYKKGDTVAMDHLVYGLDRWLKTQHPKTASGKEAYDKAHFWLREIRDELYGRGMGLESKYK